MRNSWRAVVAIAATYFYFLLFAQFAFIEGLAERAGGEGFLKPVMAAMGLGGLLGSFLAPRWVARLGGQVVLRAALLFCGVVAGGSVLVGGLVAGAVIALGMGVALGVATVVLAGCLPKWTEARRGGVMVGLGTGIAYGLCNVPAIFEASWMAQSVMSAVVAVAGGLLVPRGGRWPKRVEGSGLAGGVAAALVVLFFLVWLDSAAFYIIQHTEELKKETWGNAHLWRNAGMHFGAAILAGWLLDRGWLWRVLFGALGILSVAALMVNQVGTALTGGVLYTVAVSLYSVALVAVPGVLSGAKDEGAALRRAAWVFGIAGWVGSALGVGMGENLSRVPVGFVAVAWGLALGGRWYFVRGGRRFAVPPVIGVLVVMTAGWVFTLLAEETESPAGAVERGRGVYVAEGCIHCHSRYVRPGSGDGLAWGPVVPIGALLEERPVLFGNRRQGPDLLQVGLRRSRMWLELKLRDPRALHARSAMPAYGYLFEDGRGEDLVAFLSATRAGDFEKRLEMVGSWAPADEEAKGLSEEALYGRYCSMCHGVEGLGDGNLAKSFLRPPASLVEGPFLHTLGEQGEVLELRVARVVKFGIPGTDMPGHELLEDGEVRALAQWVLGLRGDGEKE